jgi:hypothetical protein
MNAAKVCFSLLVSLAGLAHATSSIFIAPMYTPDFMMSVNSQRAMQMRLDELNKKSAKNQDGIAPSNPSAKVSAGQSGTVQTSSLKFVPSAAVSARVKADILRTLKRQYPGNESELDRVFQRDILGAFNRQIESIGGDSHSLADVFAVFVTTMYSVARGNHETPVQWAAVLAQFRSGKLNASLGLGDNNSRQMLAEFLAYRTYVLAGARDDLRNAKDSRGLARVSDSARKTAAEYGIDLSRLQITDQGFATRN